VGEVGKNKENHVRNIDLRRDRRKGTANEVALSFLFLNKLHSKTFQSEIPTLTDRLIYS